MSVRTDMANECFRYHGDRRYCRGELPITDQYMHDADGATDQEKLENIKVEAARGCCKGCDCDNAVPDIVVRGGQRFVATHACGDPNVGTLGHRLSADE
jgi:hypothetical protein